MEATVKPRLHPLLTAAAISVTVFSAVGVGALTGVLPMSRGSVQDTTPAPLSAAAPASQAPVQASAPEVAPAMPAARASSPTPKPAKKAVARAAPPHAPAPVAYNDFGQDPRLAQASATTPPPPPVEAPRPVIPAGTFGVVESVREVSQPAEKSNGIGPIAGGIAGAVLGNQVGHGMGKNIATVLGAAGGAYAGREIEQRARAEKHWETTVRLDDGSYRTVSSSTAPIWQSGNRVRLVEGKLQPV
jgi:outer membrane lipoprotein SlyB